MRQQFVSALLIVLGLARAEHQDFRAYQAEIELIPSLSEELQAEFEGLWGTIVVATVGDKLFYGGFLSGLQANLTADDPECGATNGCGLHIHEGFGCEDSDAQGGHYFNQSVIPSDPWVDARYSTDENCQAVEGEFIDIGTTDVEGRAVLVHSQDGTRIGCALLKPIPTDQLFHAETTPQPGQQEVQANVWITTDLEYYGSDQLCYMGFATGLDPLVSSVLEGGNDCNVAETPNACGTHIHAGSDCASTETQMGHWYNQNMTVDPWADLGYLSTNDQGEALFGDCVATGEVGVESRAFIVHDTDGSRASCGLLMPIQHTAPQD